MGAKVRVQLGLSTAAYRLTHLVTPAPGGPLDLSTVVHAPGLTCVWSCQMLGVEVRKMNEHATRLLTINDAARVLAISKGQIYRLIAAGAIRAVKVGPQATRVLLEDIEKIAQEGIPRAAVQLLRRRGGGGHERR